MDIRGVSGGGANSGGLTSWQTKLSSWMDDDEEQDSDTDSKLSGSAMVDSVMKRFRSKHSHYKDGHSYVTSGEFSLDPIKDHSLLEQDEENEQVGISPTHSGLSNGYHNSAAATRSPRGQRRLMNHSNSPRTHSKSRREYENSPGGNSYLFANRKKELLSPVPESTSSGARVVEILAPGHPQQQQQQQRGVMRTWGVSEVGGGMTSSLVNTRSMENIASHGQGTSPLSRRRNYRETNIGAANGRPHYRDVRMPGSGYPSSSYSNVPPGGMYGGPGLGGGLHHSQSQEILAYSSAFMDSGDVIGRGGYPYDHDGTRSDVGMSFGVHRTSIGSSTANSYIPGSASANATPSRHVHSHSHSGTGFVPNRPTHSRSGSTGSGVPMPYMSHSQSGSGTGHHLSPQHTILSTSAPQKRSWLSDNTQLPFDLNRSPPQRRANYSRHEIPRDTSYHSGVGAMGDTSGGRYPDVVHDMARPGGVLRSDMLGSRGGEPNLNDVVDFLSSDDPSLVSNAASYLQHLAYGDDSMKSKIRQYGAIPVLVKQLRNMDTRAQIAVLGALRNLSFGRTNEQNKLEIAGEHGLAEILLALKKSKVSEVRELLTSVLWNLSSSQELQLKMVKACIHDLVNIVLVPYSCWNADSAREQLAKPDVVQWNPELRNTTGMLRNVSSAGEPARVYMRKTPMLIDTLLWILKAGVQQVSAADEKTVENVACVLRNLSYRLENEIDPQEGADDVLDREWEIEQRREIEELDRAFTKSTPGCFAFLTRPRRHDNTRNTPTIMNRPIYNIDFANPDPSSVPKRCKPVYGVALLWQPEMVYVYLAVIEQYTSCSEAVEAAAGAVQNLTACNWKWAVYSRNIVRTSNGLKLIADLLNNSHDSVVRAASTAIRNLAIDPRNKASLGVLSLHSIIPRLPFASNHLGISEDTTVALLCCLMELFDENPDNARMFHEKEGVLFLTRLTRSRQHTQKVIFAANKVCAILYDYKDCKSVLKKDGWEVSQYQKLLKESSEQFEFGSGIPSSREGSRRKKKKRSTKRSKKKDHHDNEPVGVVNVEEVQQQQRPQEMVLESHVIPGQPSSHLPEIVEEPNYQAISGQNTQQLTSRESSHQQQQLQLMPAAATSIYQSIEDTQQQPQPSKKPLPQVSSSRLETAGSTASGPASTSGPLSITSQEEEIPEPDPNATYASVDIEKKRASRRLKEKQKREQKQQAPPSSQLSPSRGSSSAGKRVSGGGAEEEEPVDSWV